MAKKKAKLQPESTTPESTEPILDTASESETPKTQIEDPIGDVTDGEARTSLAAEPDSWQAGVSTPAKSGQNEPVPHSLQKSKAPCQGRTLVVPQMPQIWRGL